MYLVLFIVFLYLFSYENHRVDIYYFTPGSIIIIVCFCNFLGEYVKHMSNFLYMMNINELDDSSTFTICIERFKAFKRSQFLCHLQFFLE